MTGQERRVKATAPLLWLGLLTWGLALAACQPSQAGDAEQAAKRQQVAALKKEAEQLRSARKLTEAAAALTKAANLERSMFGKEAPEIAETLTLLGRLHQERDDWAAATKVQQEVLAIRIKHGGAKHWQTTDARLALEYTELLSKLPADKRTQVRQADELYETAGRLGQGKDRELLKPATEAVALRKNLLGESHPEVALALHRLGRLYLGLEDGGAAKSVNEEALTIRLRTLGEIHPDVGRSRLNLGNALRGLGDRKQALKEYEQGLFVWRQTLGGNHELVAMGLNNLGDLLYYDLDDPSAARKHFEEALAIRRSKLPKDHLDIAQNLNDLGNVLRDLGDPAAARKHHEEALAIRRSKLPKDHPKIADSLGNLGNVLHSLGDLAPARKHYEEALAIYRSKLPKDHPLIANNLNALGNVLYDLKELAGARKHHEEALAIYRSKLPKDHPLIAGSLYNLGNADYGLGELAMARKHHAEALTIRRSKLPKDDSLIADSLNNLGNVLRGLGDLAAARKHHEEALAIYRSKLPKDDPLIADSLNNLGNVLRGLGDLAGARKHLEEALAIRRSKLPKEDPRIVASLIDLGSGLGDLGDPATARKHLEEALAICRSKLPKDHLLIADSLDALGSVLHNLGDAATARKHLEEALAICRSKLPKDDPRIVASLNKLGDALYDLGDLAGARKHYEKALAICRSKVPKDHPHFHIAQSLNNLGNVLASLGDLAWACKHHEEALAICRSKLPKDHPLIAYILDDLGHVLGRLGDLATARKHLEGALAIRRSKLPKDHPLIANNLNSLGHVLYDLGDRAAARKHLEGALAIRRSKFPKDHPLIASNLNSLGHVLYDLGDLAAARKHLEAALAIRRSKLPKDHPDLLDSLSKLRVVEHLEGNAEKALAYLEECTFLLLTRQERDGLARSEREQFSSAAKARPWVDRLLQELLLAKRFEQAYDLTVAAKGAVTARQRWLRFQRDFRDEPTVKLLDELRSVDWQLLQVGLENPDAKSQPRIDLGERLQALTRRRDELERALIATSPAFKTEKRRAGHGLKEIAGALPANAVLIDFVEYVPVKMGRKPAKQQTDAPRLGLFVVRPGPKLHWVDLGPSKNLAELVDRWRTSYGVVLPSSKQANPAAELRKLLWERIEPHVQEAKLILVAPEGPLNGLPLAALPGKKAGSFLLEEYAFVNIPTPQLLPDLVGKTEPRFQRPESMLLVGDVNFGEPGEPFGPLDGTRGELNNIRDTFELRFKEGKLNVLRKDKAIKPAFVAAARQHKYLHVATHGTFADPSVKSVFALENRTRALRTALTFDQQVVGEHPGLLSGLVFAGANRQDKKTEAVLTALEVGEMELRGVEVVVLSACDTGRGRVAGGEGVLGLQRAFQVAGARTTLTSLWKVRDAETQRLMSRFYENLWEKKLSRVEALRQAQLWMLREGNVRGLDLPAAPKTLPPQYWAAFVLSGDWR